MGYISYYKFNNQSEAEAAIYQINDFFKIPIDEFSETKTYCNFEERNGEFLIRHLPELEQILPNLVPVMIFITDPPN